MKAQKAQNRNLEGFFMGYYTYTHAERMLHLIKRLVWLEGIFSAITYSIGMIVSLCRGDGLSSLGALIPIGISIFILLFFRFD